MSLPGAQSSALASLGQPPEAGQECLKQQAARLASNALALWGKYLRITEESNSFLVNLKSS